MSAQRNGGSSTSSSEEEDGDAEWRAAIDSVATTSVFMSSFINGIRASSTGTPSNSYDQFELKPSSRPPKQYQIKAQKLLENMIENTLEVVKAPILLPCEDSHASEGGIRLFKKAPVGVVFDHVDEIQGPRKRPKILPGKSIKENSKKFKQQLQSIVVDGTDIIAAAKNACEKSRARLEAKETAAKAAAKREEERVSELKRVRGERWLPSIASEMKFQSQH